VVAAAAVVAAVTAVVIMVGLVAVRVCARARQRDGGNGGGGCSTHPDEGWRKAQIKRIRSNIECVSSLWNSGMLQLVRLMSIWI
jgi:hypothetical protein